MDRERVIVGIEATDISWNALLWAAGHAAVTDRDLVVVHAPSLVAPDSKARRTSNARRSSTGRHVDALLSLARATLEACAPGVAVHVLSRAGDASELLLDLAPTSAMTVIGRRVPRPRALPPGTTACALLSRSPTPVVLVSARPRSRRFKRGTIVVGATTNGGVAAVQFAAHEALRRDADLVVLRARGETLSGPDHVRGHPLTTAEGEAREHETIHEIATTVAEEFPGLCSSVRCSDLPLTVALALAAREADLAVLGEHAMGSPIDSRTNPTVNRAVRTLSYPVAVVPTPSTETTTLTSRRQTTRRTVSKPP